VPSKDLFGAQFEWLRFLSVNFYETKEEVSYVHPFPATHPRIRNAFTVVGIRSGGARDQYTGVRITQFLRRRDRYFPRHHDPTVILNILSDERAINDVEVMSDVLKALGMRQDVASGVAEEIIRNKSTLLSTGISGGFSWGDPIFSNFARAFSHSFADNVDILSPRPRLNNTIDMIFSQVCILRLIGEGKHYRCRIELNSDISDDVYMTFLRSLGFNREVYSVIKGIDHELHGLLDS
jgi:hypothetical protein